MSEMRGHILKIDAGRYEQEVAAAAAFRQALMATTVPANADEPSP